MFSLEEKKFIAAEIEKLLLELKHPEMDAINPKFSLHVDGKTDWSWADIKPNWTFNKDNRPGINPWNEVSRGLMPDPKKITCPQCSTGVEGKDSYCDDCYREYLGTHAGGREE